MKLRSILSAAICGAALQASVGAADQVPMIPQIGKIDGGFLYWSLGATVQRTTLPSYSAPGHFISEGTSRALTANPSVTSAGPAITVGYVFDGMGFGVRPRIEAAMSYTALGQDNHTRGPVVVNSEYHGFQVDGDAAPPFGPADRYVMHLRTKLEGGDAVVRFRTDFKVAPAVTVSPGLGVIAGGQMLKYNYTLTQTYGPDPRFVATHYTFEKALTARVGSQLVVDATWGATDALTFSAGLDAQVYLQRSQLKATSCFSGDFAGDTCVPFLSGTRRFLGETDTKIGGSIGASLGVTYNWGWAEVSLAGFGRRVFNAPGVHNPGPDDRTRTSLRYENTWNYGGFLQVTFPLAGLMR